MFGTTVIMNRPGSPGHSPQRRRVTYVTPSARENAVRPAFINLATNEEVGDEQPRRGCQLPAVTGATRARRAAMMLGATMRLVRGFSDGRFRLSMVRAT